MNAVDTNVLIYAHDPQDPAKNSVATSLIDSLTDGVLLWQVACEFLWASRKLAAFGYDQMQAWNEVRKLRRARRTVVPDWTVMDQASSLLTKYSLSFWDAMIVAACLKGGVTLLYSEDFDSYKTIEGLSLINPFKVP